MASKAKAKPAAKKPARKAAAPKSATKNVAAATVATKGAVARKRPVRATAPKSPAGRKPLVEGQPTIGRSVRMAESYWAKVDKLGGVRFLRKLVDKARVADRVLATEAY